MRRPRLRFSTAWLARVCARHSWIVVGVWVVILALAAVSATGLGGALTAKELEATNEPEAVRGEILLQERLRGPEPEMETVIIRSETLTVDRPEFQAVVGQTSEALSQLTSIVASAPTYYQLEAMGMPAAASMVSADGHSTIIPVTLTAAEAGGPDRLDAFLDTVAAQQVEGFEILTIGSGSVGREMMQTAEDDLLRVEVFGVPVTLFVLILVFGALVAAGVSLALAGVSILVAVGATALVGQVVDLSFFVVNVVAMLGMAVGIDYALFITERYREERRNGVEKQAAIEIAGATASRAVLFSGLTVILALLGLFLVPITTFRSLGIGAVLVVAAALLAMLTLVPALLSLLGDRIDWPRFRLLARLKGRMVAWRRGAPAAMPAGASVVGSVEGRAGAPGSGEETVYSGFWGRTVKRVVARPVLSVVIVGTLLAGAAIPYVWVEKGESGASALPPGEVKTAYEILSRDFSAGLVTPVDVVVDAQRTPEVEAALARVGGAVAENPFFVPGAQAVWNDRGDVALLPVLLAVDAASLKAMEAVRELRAEVIPTAFAGLDAEVLVTGETAFNVDSVSVIDSRTPGVFAFVLGLSFLVLLLVFRSLVYR